MKIFYEGGERNSHGIKKIRHNSVIEITKGELNGVLKSLSKKLREELPTF